jgi:ornithine cyclodeaminase/alanine dehydrogenase-like protein (mu-crystallin family)
MSSAITVLTDETVQSLFTYGDIIDLVEAAFKADALGQVTVFPIIMHPIPALEAEYGIKSSHMRLENGLESKQVGLGQRM